MKPTFQIALILTLLGWLAFHGRVATAETAATTAIHRSSDEAVSVTPVGGYRPYRGYYRSYGRPYYARRPYYAYRPYAYRPYAYWPYVYPPYAYPAYGYGYGVSIRSPAYFGYRYPGASRRGYYGRPRVYRGF